MAALSDEADAVYAEGTVPVDALRELQVDWWQLQTHTPGFNIEALPAGARLSAQDKAAAAAETLSRGHRARSTACRSPRRRGRRTEFAAASQQYLGLLAEIQAVGTAPSSRRPRRRPPSPPAARDHAEEQQAAAAQVAARCSR